MWVRGHSRSLKVVPFESQGMVSYSYSIVPMTTFLAISEILRHARSRKSATRFSTRFAAS